MAIKQLKQMENRVVISSFGVISSLGSNEKEIIQNLKTEKTNFKKTQFDKKKIAAPVDDFNINNFVSSFKNKRYLNRGSQFALSSLVLTLKKAKLSQDALSSCALFVGTSFPFEFLDKTPKKAMWILNYLPNTITSVISQFFGIHGQNQSVINACSASLDAIGLAYQYVKENKSKLAIAGAGDSRINPTGIAAYSSAQAYFDEETEKPSSSMKPFDKKRSGFVCGEGGAFFVIEDFKEAKKRGAEIYAEIVGYSNSLDAHSMSAPCKSGKWAKEAILSAICEGKIKSSQIDLILAHGTSTVLNDKIEATIIKEIYKENMPKITALKSFLGHLSSACGAVELAILLFCMKNNFMPKIRNLKDPCTKSLNFLFENKEEKINYALVENFGFGGQNSALLIKNLS